MNGLAWVLPVLRRRLLVASEGGGHGLPHLAWLAPVLARAGLSLPCGHADSLTLLAPSDSAVLSAGWRPDEVSDTELNAWLLRHLTLEDVGRAQALPMLDGQWLHRQADGDGWRDAGGGAVQRHGAATRVDGLRVIAIDRVLPPLTATLRGRLAASPGLGRFSDALEATGLSALLDCAGPFTLFAPSDRALSRAAVRLGCGPALWADRAGLTQLLSRHIVSGRWPSQALPWGGRLRAVSGEQLAFNALGQVRSGDLWLPLAAGRDELCRNGVLHRLDEALLPGD